MNIPPVINEDTWRDIWTRRYIMFEEDVGMNSALPAFRRHCVRITLDGWARASGICLGLSRINSVIVVNPSKVRVKGASTLSRASLSAVSIADSISTTYFTRLSYIKAAETWVICYAISWERSCIPMQTANRIRNLGRRVNRSMRDWLSAFAFKVTSFIGLLFRINISNYSYYTG